MTAPAATATKPAINAYSIRSWPRVSFKAFSFNIKFLIASSPPNFYRHILSLIHNNSHIDLGTSGFGREHAVKRPDLKGPKPYHFRVPMPIAGRLWRTTPRDSRQALLALMRLSPLDATAE